MKKIAVIQLATNLSQVTNFVVFYVLKLIIMQNSNWTKTNLYRHLNKKKDQASIDMKTLLHRPEVMDTIEFIISKSGSTPKDFTLHDADHSFRVAQRMWDIIPEKTRNKLSPYELALLLLSAYLHDIGMSPDFEKVEKHKDFLTTTNDVDLSEQDIRQFQKWIDENDKIKNIDIRSEKISDPILSSYAISYYIRSRHNDWSGEWIEKNLSTIPLSGYPFWHKDLILICQSHHEGIDALAKDNFDPKPVNTKYFVHLRYLSMCLRVADVMENDPERTPKVILQHRHISIDSLKYWLKDQHLQIIPSNNKFTAYARPDKAFIQRAVEETVDWIEDELKLCYDLIKIKPLDYCTVTKLPYYEWKLETAIHRDISPQDDSYEYIDGGFKPNTAKILELLGGNQLYGDSIWAYRELIQNAFDAVKERIAYQIVNEDRDPSTYLDLLGELYSIDIRLEKRNDGHWLICRDHGVGMTKNIIERFFLESGSSKRHEIHELERKCSKKGFNFSRTGQFGIGVLSYFMLAEKLIVRTKRLQNTGYSDPESIAWYFEINGTHDFGELRKTNLQIEGTTVELKLKQNIESEIHLYDVNFANFLKRNVIYSPCTINYFSVISNTKINSNIKWGNTLDEIKVKIIEKYYACHDSYDHHKRNNLILQKWVERKHKERDTVAINSKIMLEKIDFYVLEGDIKNIGQYRVVIPYFNLSRGKSLFFMHEKNIDGKVYVSSSLGSDIWRPRFELLIFGLKGINILLKNHNNRSENTYDFAHIEINIDSIDQTSVDVSRTHFQPHQNTDSIIQLVNTEIDKFLISHDNELNNFYASLIRSILKKAPNEVNWFYKSEGDENHESNESYFVFEELKLPSLAQETRHQFRNEKLERINSNEPLYYVQNIRERFEDSASTVHNISYSFHEYNTAILKQPNGGWRLILIANTIKLCTEDDYRIRKINLPKQLENVMLFSEQSLDLYRYSSYNYLINTIFFDKYNLNINDLKYTEKYFESLTSDLHKINTPSLAFSIMLSLIAEYAMHWEDLAKEKKDLLSHCLTQVDCSNFSVIISSRNECVQFTKDGKTTIKLGSFDTMFPTQKEDEHLFVKGGI